MGKILREYQNKDERIVVLRYLIGGKFRFTIETTDFNENVVTELQYIDHESAMSVFDDLTMSYDFNEV